jgi:uroporphyrinogen-III decarboxylase
MKQTLGKQALSAIHNILPGTPVRNIAAIIDAVHEFNGK